MVVKEERAVPVEPVLMTPAQILLQVLAILATAVTAATADAAAMAATAHLQPTLYTFTVQVAQAEQEE